MSAVTFGRKDDTEPYDASTTSRSTMELAQLALEKLSESGIDTLTKSLEATTRLAQRGVIPYLLGAGCS